MSDSTPTTGTRRPVERVLLFRSPLAFHEQVGHEDPHPPLELLLLAAVLRRDHDVLLLDGQRDSRRIHDAGERQLLGLSWPEILAEASAFAPDLVGISVMWHHQTTNAIGFARRLRRHLPDARIVVGGVAPSNCPEHFLESSDIDFAIVGDGEDAILELCRTLSSGGPLEKVPNLAFLRGGELVRTPRAVLRDLDTYPFPALDLVDLSMYQGGFRHGYHKATPMTGYLPTRGCPLACAFCSLPAVSGQRFRRHGIDRVISDLCRLRDDFGVREVHFYDDNLVNARGFIKELFREMIRRKVGLHWLAEAGFAVWKLDRELIELAVESGLHRLDLPIETGDEQVRGGIMSKGFYTNAHLPRVLRWAREAGVERIHGYVIVGSPGETLDQIRRTLCTLHDLDLDYRGVRYAQPFPGTRFHRTCEENRWLDERFHLDRLWFTLPNISTDQFSVEDVMVLVESARGAAMIERGTVSYREAVAEVRRKHGPAIAERTGPGIRKLARDGFAVERML